MEVATHGKRVWEVRVHPSLPYYATVSADRTAQIHDSRSHALLKELRGVHERSIRSVSWRPATPQLALGSFDATLSVFALEEPKWEFLAQLEGHDSEVKRVAWSSTGMYLASCARDKSVWIWEVDEAGEDFECCAVLQDHTQDVKHVAWHPAEEILASASYDDSIKLWRRDDDEWVCVASLDGPDGHTSTVWACDFDLGSMRLASCSADGKVKIWRKVAEFGGSGTNSLPSVARWDVLHEQWELECDLPEIHTAPVYSVKWGKNGKIASTGSDGMVVIYTFKDKWEIEVVHEQAHGVYEVNSVDWLGNSVISAGDDGKVKVWKHYLEQIQ